MKGGLALLILLFAVGAFLVQSSIPPTHYQCSYCLGVVDKALEKEGEMQDLNLWDGCKATFPEGTEYCELAFKKEDHVKLLSRDSRESCAGAGFCPRGDELWSTQGPKSLVGLDVRVSKAMGSRGYNKIRLSIVANHSISSEHFSYSSPFKHRWTQNSLIGPTYLNSGIVTVTPGVKTQLSIEGQTVNLYLPKDGEGVRGVIIADPCFTSQYILCA